MDPLSDVLSLLKPRSYMVRGFDVAGQWSIRFAPKEGIKCYSVLAGHCWLAMDDVPEPLLLKDGDRILLPTGRAFRLASDLALEPVDAVAFVSSAPVGGIASFNGGGECFGIGGWFAFAGKHAEILLGVLPPIVHIRKETDQAALRWCLERMMQELREPQPGGVLVAQHLAHMLLVQALRLHLGEGLRGGVGWLFALADKQIGAAISAVHDDPARRWTLQALAKRAGMSRSTFAVKFKQTVGASPMEYLTRWRMLLAGDRLTNSRESISVIAPSLGYESESAFSTAFKRVMGCSPRQYSQCRSLASPSPREGEGIRVNRLEPVAD